MASLCGTDVLVAKIKLCRVTSDCLLRLHPPSYRVGKVVCNPPSEALPSADVHSFYQATPSLRAAYIQQWVHAGVWRPIPSLQKWVGISGHSCVWLAEASIAVLSGFNATLYSVLLSSSLAYVGLHSSHCPQNHPSLCWSAVHLRYHQCISCPNK